MVWIALNALRFARWYGREMGFEVRSRLPALRAASVPPALWRAGVESYRLENAGLVEQAKQAAKAMIDEADVLERRQEYIVKRDGEGSIRIMWSPSADSRFDAVARAVTQDWFAAYLGRRPVAEYFMVQLSRPTQSANRFGRSGYHVDSHLRSLKTYMYLSDVEVDNGPLVMVSGANHLTARQFGQVLKVHLRTRDVAYERLDPFWYYVKPGDDLYEALDGHSRPMTGPTGTVVNFDTRTFHKAGEHRNGERLVFAIYWL